MEPHRSALDSAKVVRGPPFDLIIPAKDRSFQIEMEVEKTDHEALKRRASKFDRENFAETCIDHAVAIVAFMVYDRASKEEWLGRLTNAIQCLIEQNGDGFPLSTDLKSYLQKGIQNKIVKEFNQTETTILFHLKMEISKFKSKPQKVPELFLC